VGTTTPAATLDVNGTINAATSYKLGEHTFAYGSYANQNAFLGFAGNATMTAGGNTASGWEALSSNTTGGDNTAIGWKALSSNTTGTSNTASGLGALSHNTTGTTNTANGDSALYWNTTGNFDTASGTSALGYNTTGTSNTANGDAALYWNTTGNNNTATGDSALFYNTTGHDNTASGTDALFSNTTGSNNTALGYNAGPDRKTTNLSYTTAIGAGAVVSRSNALVLGGPLGSGANVSVGIGTATPTNVFTIAQTAGQAISDGWATYSSRRWKTNIQPLHDALGMVEQLRGVSYNLKESGKHEIGVIAEEVGAVVPEVVSYEENRKDARGVDYSRLTALLIEATKEQQREIQHQQAALRMQAAAIRDLKSELRATRQTLQKVKAQVAAAQLALVATK
jgi:trimeric autotransporter adhesin